MTAKSAKRGQQGGSTEWAEAMRSVLDTEKPKSKTSVILSRSEKLDPRNEKDDSSDSDQVQTVGKREWTNRGRYDPCLLEDRGREKRLKSIAVSGVVQLFMAVSKHKSTIQTPVSSGSAHDKKYSFKAMNKESFFNLLSDGGDAEIKTEESPFDASLKEDDDFDTKKGSEKTWDVVRTDFMMSTKLKDWDTQL